MPSFKETFSSSHAILPVIHVQDKAHAIRNAGIAQEAGADGAFLISMEGMPCYELADVLKSVKNQFKTWWIGVNYLDLPIIKTFDELNEADGVWTDRSHIEEWAKQQVKAELISNTRQESGWEGLYFGGVAFKYQEPVARENLGLVAQIASKYMDVVTTSGDGTGYAPDTEKIAIMKASIGKHPLGIASGISPENVYLFKENADAFLVATSLLIPKTDEFDPSRVRALVEAVRD